MERSKKLTNLIGTKAPLINEDTIHRAKVVARKRELNKIKDDNLNGNLIREVESQYLPTGFEGTHPISQFRKEKEIKARRERRAWKILWVLIFVLFIIGMFGNF